VPSESYDVTMAQLQPGTASGALEVIPSKSSAHRLLICAALAQGETEVACPQSSQDIDATVACLEGLGALIHHDHRGFQVTPLGKAPRGEACLLPCRESGSTLRFLLPVAGALGALATFPLEGRLGQRPMEPLVEQLARHGCTIRQEPDRVTISGQLRPGHYVLPGDVSSQFISGLLMALPLLEGPSTLEVTGEVQSVGYIQMTLRALAAFGVRPHQQGWTFTIPAQGYRSPGAALAEGDWSNAAPWLCMGALGGTGIFLRGLDPNSLQGDREVCEILSRMGARIHWDGDLLTVRPGQLQAATIDARNVPDLVPVLSAVAALTPGETRIIHAERLRLKESNRLQTTAQVLNALGGDVTETFDGLRIRGRETLAGGVVDSHLDHRIAMAAAVASTGCEGPVVVRMADAVKKSYPAFWLHMEQLGRQVKMI
jgi:3-phosphoshikimate 1-carboxyvinyltransferase